MASQTFLEVYFTNLLGISQSNQVNKINHSTQFELVFGDIKWLLLIVLGIIVK
jgi:hypothetical protein